MNYSDNYYTRTKSYKVDSSKLNESIQCDVCIVGAGLTGISTAYYLSELDPSLKIVVLEKNKIGWGASGRNGGSCYMVILLTHLMVKKIYPMTKRRFYGIFQ